MRISEFRSSQELPAPLDEVFPFFADATNLERITPDWLSFRVATPRPIEMREGTVIDYRLRLKGVPIRWRSEIAEWRPPHAFVDRQVRGPYRKWIHAHSFTPTPKGTRVDDIVRYAVPGGYVIDRLIVRGDIERIFAYRRDALVDIFGDREPSYRRAVYERSP